MTAIGIIPARYASTRFPGKPLAMISGKSMIERVYSQAAKADLDRVIVATDDPGIADEVRSFRGDVVITGEHPTGTDRIAEAVKNLKCDIVVNIQGDEPLILPEIINTVVKSLKKNKWAHASTAASKITDRSEIDNPNIVKVVFSSQGKALYFSRSPIPYDKSRSSTYFRHIGIYGYRRAFFKTFVSLPRSSLEIAESLEQLRLLQNGFNIQVSVVDYHPIGVDIPDDIKRVEDAIRKKSNIK